MKENTKEAIKKRMIQKAAALWGVPANEIEMSFDPIVSMLLSVCASEMEKISGEMDQSQTRITEKLIQLMTPESVYGPRPSHAIMYAESVDGKLAITPEYLFAFQKAVSKKNTSVSIRDVHFSPIQDFNLTDARVRYVLAGDSLLEYESDKSAKIIANAIKSASISDSTMLIGLSSKSKEIDIARLSFYFELMDVSGNELFYHYLRSARWYSEAQSIPTHSGFYSKDDIDQVTLDHIFEEVSNKSQNVCQQTRNIYRKHFVTVSSKAKSLKFPKNDKSEIDLLLEEHKIQLEDSVVWIRIEFPRMITSALLKQVFCSVNAFPVLNRDLRSFSYRLKELINIIPIKSENLFFDVHNIENTSGQTYRARVRDNMNEDKGTYLIRVDDVGKLDKRKARDYLVHLIGLLKDESAAFSFIDNDFLNTYLNKLNQMIALMEKKVATGYYKVDETSYVSVKPYQPNETLTVEFWTTDGVFANGIKTGSELSVFKGIGIRRGSGKLLTTSHGARDDVSMSDRLNSYRRSLLSRNRIVTREDVKALCYELFGDKITAASVKKGYVRDIGSKNGMVQCMELNLIASNQKETAPEEWDTLRANLLYQLENKSTNVFPYKINIVT